MKACKRVRLCRAERLGCGLLESMGGNTWHDLSALQIGAQDALEADLWEEN